MSGSENFNFSQPELNSSYKLQWELGEEDAMDGVVYKVTNSIFSSMFEENLLPPEILDKLDFDDPNLFLEELANNWQGLVTENWRFCFAIIFGLIMALLLPIVGIVWCSFKCCCRNKPGQRQNSDALCIGSGVFVLMVTSILFGLFGAIWYYASNSVLSDGIDVLPQKLDDAFDDIDLYINNTVKQVDHLAFDNFKEVRERFNDSMTETEVNLNEKMNAIVKEIEFNQLINMTKFVAEKSLNFNDTLKAIGERAQALKNSSTDAAEILVEIKKLVWDLTGNDTFCNYSSPTECIALNASVNAIVINTTSIDGIPISTSAFELKPEQLKAVSDFRGKVDETQTQLDTFSGNVIKDFTDDIDTKLESIGKDIEGEVEKVTAELKEIGLESLQTTDLNDAVDIFTDIVHQVLLVPMGLLCIILVLIFIGSLLGCCGKAGGSVKAWGSNLFCCSLGLFFFLGFFFWLFTVVLFFSGALTEKMICETIRHPNDSELSGKLNAFFQDTLQGSSSSFTINLTLSDFVERCDGEGEAVYTLLNLTQVYNVSKLNNWREEYDINPVLAAVRAQITALVENVVNMTNLDPETLTNIKAIKDTLGMVETEFFDQAGSIDVDQVVPIGDIDGAIGKFKEINNSTLGSLFGSQLTSIIDKFKELKSSAEIIKADLDNLAHFDTNLTYNGAFMTDVISNATKTLSDANTYLNATGRTELNTTSEETIDTIMNLVDEFTDYAVKYMTQDVGRCGPLRHLYDGLLTNSICHDIVAPFNGLWSGIGIVIFFMIPGLFIICCLDNLFGREKQRPRYPMTQFDGLPESKMVIAETKFSYEVPDHYKGLKGGRK